MPKKPPPSRPCELDSCPELVTRTGARFCSVSCARRARPVAPRPTKVCVVCCGVFERRARSSDAQWEARKACSIQHENQRDGVRGRQATPGAARAGNRTAPRPVPSRDRRKPPQQAPESSVGPPREPWRPANLGRDVRPQIGV